MAGTNVLQTLTHLLATLLYTVASNVVSGYHYLMDKYMEYKYTTNEIAPTQRYFLTAEGRDTHVDDVSVVPADGVYIEEWVDTKGHQKTLAFYGGAVIPTAWTSEMSPFQKALPKCPWVWVGDRDTEIDLTRMFDKFLVPGNVLKPELVSKLTDQAHLIYIETKTFNQVKFPGDGITIEADEE